MVKLDIRTPDSKGKADEQYAPYSNDETARNLHNQENDAIPDYSDDLDSHPVNSGDASGKSGDLNGGSKTKNIDDTKKKEEDTGPWNNFYVNPEGQRKKITVKNFFKKKGPASLIIGLLLGGGGLVSFFSPGLLVLDLKEKLTAAFNDQLSVMDVRTTTMLKKKFGGTVTGICTSKITVRCRYNTMSNKQLKKLEAAGIKVDKKGNTLLGEKLGRNKINGLEFEGTKVNASNFASELRTNPAFRGAMLKAYSPKLAGFADATFAKLAKKLGITKQKNVTGATDKEREKSVVDSANGDKVAETGAKVSSTEEDCTSGPDCTNGKKTVYRDTVTGDIITKEQYDTRIANGDALAGELKARKALAETGSTAAKATLKGALTVTALGLGAVDTACTGYTLIRTVSFAAKYLGALQLLRFAQVFMNTGDSIKALVADPGAVEYAGKILTSTNSVGQSATDSYGYHYAAYGDAGQMAKSDNLQVQSAGADGNNVSLSDKEKQKVLLNDETTKYVSGQLVGRGIISTLASKINGGINSKELDKTCKFIKSGWGQTIVIGTAVVGAVVAFFSGGLSVGWGTGVQIAAGAAVSVAIAMLTPKLIDMAAGTLIGKDELTNGNRAGNAIVSGMGTYNDQASQARGIPVLKKKNAAAYNQLNQQTVAEYNAADRATHSPLDATNPNTFMGSLVSSIIPYTAKMSSLSGGIASLTQFTTSSFASLIPHTSAADPSAQYDICTDPEYNDLDLAADPFCNLKRGMDSASLAIDPDTADDYVVSQGYADLETGLPTAADNDYANYIKECPDRSVSIGGYSESDGNTGEECIQGNASETPTKVINCTTVGDDGMATAADPCKKNCTAGNDNDNKECKYNMFRLAYIDLSVDDGMENGMANSSNSDPKANANGPVKSPVSPNPTIVSGYGPRSQPPGVQGTSTWHSALSLTAKPTDVFASMAGDVVTADSASKTIVIKHADGLKTVYKNVTPLAKPIKVGDKVTASQKIGTIDASKKYLEFSILIDEVQDKGLYAKYQTAPIEGGAGIGSAINPANYLKDNGVTGYDGAVNAN
ncbi:MAG: hypothetical protein JWP06_1098 [Candidatus Saccharibacteria bacterium]|nr:hypothetical protein [Candidatus Saccharibacteria bacterium]